MMISIGSLILVRNRGTVSDLLHRLKSLEVLLKMLDYWNLISWVMNSLRVVREWALTMLRQDSTGGSVMKLLATYLAAYLTPPYSLLI